MDVILKGEDRYLIRRGKHWHYVRRVPSSCRGIDDRRFVRVTLGTTSLELARERRDALEVADNDHWSLLKASNARPEERSDLSTQLQARYKAATSRARARGLIYAPAGELSSALSLSELMERVVTLQRLDTGAANSPIKAEADAVLGGIKRPKPKLSEALETYCSEIALGETLNKSPNQRKLWFKTKKRAISYFIDVVADKPIEEITREDALTFYNWWAERLKPKKGAKPKGANTANRDLGNLRKLFREYFKYIGEEDRSNPFRNLSFKEASLSETPPFTDQWVQSKILVPGALSGINEQAQLIVYALIETGCRPSEISSLMSDDIFLDADVPYISIRPRQGREIKTSSSIRDIPLVGVSLAAMKRAPNGFPHYRDRNDLLSQSLVKAFRNRHLFPSNKHVIYSFRHSFEKRMLEASIDYGLRCLLMGHSTSRPAYGDGGSLSYRRNELLKIAHPFPDNMFCGS